MLSNIKTAGLKTIDVIISPVVFLSSWLLKYIRSKGLERFPLSRKIFRKVGMFPIIDHYYEPNFQPVPKNNSLRASGSIKGIDFSVEAQLELLKKLTYSTELDSDTLRAMLKSPGDQDVYPFYLPSEAEYYYSMIRHFKPKRIVEIGSGFSTIIAEMAVRKNRDDGANCRISCIEPFENSWLESHDVEVIREKVENIDPEYFSKLEQNDILFIDSSHMIKPWGDVMFEYFKILPVLQNGVLIHVHDIFTPRDYPENWLNDRISFWNEQYLLEALLVNNRDYTILGMMNYLRHNQFDKLADSFPSLRQIPGQEPSSFWMMKSRPV